VGDVDSQEKSYADEKNEGMPFSHILNLDFKNKNSEEKG
jgi:hypothetical protein